VKAEFVLTPDAGHDLEVSWNLAVGSGLLSHSREPSPLSFQRPGADLREHRAGALFAL